MLLPRLRAFLFEPFECLWLIASFDNSWLALFATLLLLLLFLFGFMLVGTYLGLVPSLLIAVVSFGSSAMTLRYMKSRIRTPFVPTPILSHLTTALPTESNAVISPRLCAGSANRGYLIVCVTSTTAPTRSISRRLVGGGASGFFIIAAAWVSAGSMFTYFITRRIQCCCPTESAPNDSLLDNKATAVPLVSSSTLVGVATLPLYGLAKDNGDVNDVSLD
jgi:hypothetical protein